eukprot:gene29550-19585_t
MAFVEFDTTEAAQKALAQRNLQLRGNIIYVTPNASAHSEYVPPKKPVEVPGPKYKKKMCNFFITGKQCFRGDGCSFAHHPRELAPGTALPPKGEMIVLQQMQCSSSTCTSAAAAATLQSTASAPPTAPTAPATAAAAAATLPTT